MLRYSLDSLFIICLEVKATGKCLHVAFQLGYMYSNAYFTSLVYISDEPSTSVLSYSKENIWAGVLFSLVFVLILSIFWLRSYTCIIRINVGTIYKTLDNILEIDGHQLYAWKIMTHYHVPPEPSIQARARKKRERSTIVFYVILLSVNWLYRQQIIIFNIFQPVSHFMEYSGLWCNILYVLKHVFKLKSAHIHNSQRKLPCLIFINSNREQYS